MGELSVNGNNPENDQNEIITDKDLPLSFVENRHLGPIVGTDCLAPHMWRMKERVSTKISAIPCKLIIINFR